MKKKTPSTAPGSFLESFAEAAGLNRIKKIDHPRLYYLCGAVTHDPHYRLKFDLAERYLKSKGHQVINTIKREAPGQTWAEYLAADLRMLQRLMTVYEQIIMMVPDQGVPLPAIALIDPDDRAFPSKGMELEIAFAGHLLPTVKLSHEWNELLTAAIEKIEKEGEKR